MCEKWLKVQLFVRAPPLAESGAVEEGDDLRSGAGGVWGEGGRAGAVGDAPGGGPADGGGVVGVGADIGKGHAVAGVHRPGEAVEIGHGLPTGNGLIGGEGGGIGAVGDAPLIGPEHSVIAVAPHEHIAEGIFAVGRGTARHPP